MTNIFIFNNASRAANYGIGTYVKHLTCGLIDIPETTISLIEMYADTKEFAISEDEYGIRHYLIPPHSQMENEAYCRIIFYFLARNIETNKKEQIVFLFNYFQHYPLAVLLKAWSPDCKIALTVHYMNWCFELRGNVQYMKEITTEGHKPKDDVERRVISSFADERAFMHLADIIFVLSKSTKEILVNDYNVSLAKIYLVYNGIFGEIINMGNSANRNRHILFVGRLDEIKGLKYLIDAFCLITEKYPDTNLIIAGDGDFQAYINQSRKLLGRVVFMGRIHQNELEEIYQSAYIGVMPSFHEQCSYTAIEMMRHGIPIIGTDSTGLKEMLDATPHLRIHINDENFDENVFISQLASRMDLLLSSYKTYQQASNIVLKQYKERYTMTTMIQGVQKAVLISKKNTGSNISSDYLPHIDKQMITLINKCPDIDMDFYGLSGIGVYLWWRILQLETEKTKNADQIALIKENLIYYLDWIEEICENEPISTELFDTLSCMKSHSFYPTKVDSILKKSKKINGFSRFLSEQTILQNALKICTCKI